MSAETYDLLVASLKNLGITNAEDVLSDLKDIQEELIDAGYNLADITIQEASELLNLGIVSQETAEYLRLYLVQKELTQNPLNTSADIAALESLCNSLGITGELYEYVISLKKAFEAKEAGAVSDGLDQSIEDFKKKIERFTVLNGKNIPNPVTEDEVKSGRILLLLIMAVTTIFNGNVFLWILELIIYHNWAKHKKYN